MSAFEDTIKAAAVLLILGLFAYGVYCFRDILFGINFH